MNLIKWLLEHHPGTKEQYDHCTAIAHKDGDNSCFFTREDETDNISTIPESIRFLYNDFDGIDLFDSAFQICSFSRNVEVEGEKAIGNLAELRDLIKGIQFPEPSLPFMVEALDGPAYVYAASMKSKQIFCFDLELDVFDVYDSFLEIIEGWIEETAAE